MIDSCYIPRLLSKHIALRLIQNIEIITSKPVVLGLQ